MSSNSVLECVEDCRPFDWVWDANGKSAAAHLQNNNREVRFHAEYSCGTAAARGNRPLTSNQHYWEIKMTSPVYGTDMMVGVGTGHASVDSHRYNFCSLLGSDCESWGLSYTGLFHHAGESYCYSPRFGQGSIIGVHLDMWNGTLSFYKNRQPLGIACTGLKGKVLYPMVSSTAARSGMTVIRSCSFTSSLQYLCCAALRKMIPLEKNVLDMVKFPPGLNSFLENNLDWLLEPCALSSLPSMFNCCVLSDCYSRNIVNRKQNTLATTVLSCASSTACGCQGEQAAAKPNSAGESTFLHFGIQRTVAWPYNCGCHRSSVTNGLCRRKAGFQMEGNKFRIGSQSTFKGTSGHVGPFFPSTSPENEYQLYFPSTSASQAQAHKRPGGEELSDIENDTSIAATVPSSLVLETLPSLLLVTDCSTSEMLLDRLGQQDFKDDDEQDTTSKNCKKRKM